MGIYSVKTAKLNFLLELKRGIKFTLYVNEKRIDRMSPFLYNERNRKGQSFQICRGIIK